MKRRMSGSAHGKLSALAIMALSLALFQIILLGAAKLFQMPLGLTQLGALGIINFILSLVAFFRIQKSAGALKGKALAVLSLILSLLPIFFLIAFLISISQMKR